MKINSKGENGSMLMIMMIFSVIVGTSLLGILKWAQHENKMTIRSKAWNAALPLAESGVEEALAHLAFTNNILSSGWELKGEAITKSRHLGSDYFVASILTNGSNLDIISKGLVQLPLSATQYMTRTIRVAVTNEPLFQAALASKQLLSLQGKVLRTDSFDSEDPAFNTAGRYDPARIKESGHVHSVAGIANGQPKLGGSFILGRLKTGQSAMMELGDAGVVGDRDWHRAGNTGVQPGWAANDMRATFPDFKVPDGAIPPAGGTINGVTYQYVLPTGNWIVNEVRGSIYVSGDAILTVRGNLYINSGLDSLVIAPGASLKVFMLGNNAIFWGGKTVGAISNLTHKAESFQFYGKNTDMTIAASPDITGLFYAPDAYVWLGSYGGTGATDIKGAMVVRGITLQGDVSIHFDEAARKIPSPILKVSSWEELSPNKSPLSLTQVQQP